MNKKLVRLACVTLVTAMVLSVTQPLRATSINDEKKKQQELEKELKDSKSMLNELQSLKSDTNAYIAALDKKLNKINNNIDSLNQQAADKQAEIDKTNVTLTEQQQDITNQYESMKKRIKFMYENGNADYLELLLGSDNIGDLLNKAEYISRITEYDRDMLKKMKDTKEQIEATKVTLENEQKNLDALVAEAKEEQKSVEVLMADKKQQLESTQSQISNTQTQIDQQQGEIEAQKQIVKELEELERKRKEEEERRRQLAAQQAAQGNGSTSSPTYDGGMMKWPVPGYTTISSDFGYRTAPDTNNPNAGKPELHSGLDIPAPSGTQIVAAYDGEVDWASVSASAGNWIGIYHGNGLYTVYMHTSKMLVSKGQKVKKGDVIALVGSTGWSTGAHLHFSVRLNGEYVNPHNYVK